MIWYDIFDGWKSSVFLFNFYREFFVTQLENSLRDWTLVRAEVVVVFRRERLNISKQFATLFLMLMGTKNNDHTITHTFIIKSEMSVNPHQN